MCGTGILTKSTTKNNPVVVVICVERGFQAWLKPIQGVEGGGNLKEHLVGLDTSKVEGGLG